LLVLLDAFKDICHVGYVLVLGLRKCKLILIGRVLKGTTRVRYVTEFFFVLLMTKFGCICWNAHRYRFKVIDKGSAIGRQSCYVIVAARQVVSCRCSTVIAERMMTS